MKTHQIQMAGAALRRIGQRFLCGVALLLPLCATSCSSDDDDDDSSKSSELEYVQIQVTSESDVAPNGNVYLFKVTGYELESDRPLTVLDYKPVLDYKYNGETKYLLPISKYGTKSGGDLLKMEDFNCSVASFYWSSLDTSYGTPKAGDEYIVYVKLRSGDYVKASKRFTITKNSTIKVYLEDADESAHTTWVDGEWSISDYEELR